MSIHQLYDTVLEGLLKATYEAGKAILTIYDTDDFEVDFKSDNSPLTKADKKAHTILKTFLETTAWPVLSEEGAEVDFNEREQWGTFWLIDPLDGTKEFIKRNGEFTINIALINNGVPVHGVVYAPVLEALYYTTANGGVFKKTGYENPIQIQAQTFNQHDLGLTVVASRSHLSPETEAFISKLNQPNTISMGSSLKILLVAEGKAALYPRFAPTMEWDTAAAHAILKAAGGEILQAPAMHTPLTYNKKNLLNPWFLAQGNKIQ